MSRVEAEVETYPSGSYDDQPEQFVQTVLTVPLSLPVSQAAAQLPRRRHAAHKNSSQHSELWTTTWIGLLSAGIVISVCAFLLLAAGRFLA